MQLSRFLIGLALLALALLVFNVTSSGGDYVSAIAQSIGGVAGALIWGLLLWAPVRLVQGPERAPDVRTFALYTAAAFVGESADRDGRHAFGKAGGVMVNRLQEKSEAGDN